MANEHWEEKEAGNRILMTLSEWWWEEHLTRALPYSSHKAPGQISNGFSYLYDTSLWGVNMEVWKERVHQTDSGTS